MNSGVLKETIMFRELPVILAGVTLAAEYNLAELYLEIETLQLRWDLLLQTLGG